MYITCISHVFYMHFTCIFRQPQDMDDIALWEAVLELMLRPPLRQPLDHVTSVQDVVSLIEKSKKIIVLSGAGVSSCHGYEPGCYGNVFSC